jgi:hypothetical protein
MSYLFLDRVTLAWLLVLRAGPNTLVSIPFNAFLTSALVMSSLRIADCCKRVLLRLRLDFEFSDFWVSFLVNLVPANTGQ